VVENRVGAKHHYAATYVVRAEPDGYTLLFAGFGSAHPIFSRSNAVDLSKNLLPISNVQATPYFYYVRGTLPIHSVRELLAYVRANPGKLNFGSSFLTSELSLAVFKNRQGADTSFPVAVIPYKSDSQVATALLAGEVDLASSAPAAYLGRDSQRSNSPNSSRFGKALCAVSRRTNWSRTRPRQF